MNPSDVYYGNDGAATTALYNELRSRGPIGHIAECLFRAQKKSSRAKAYRGPSRRQSYDDKQSSMDQLVKMLEKHPDLGFRFGWKPDPAVPFADEASFVLYVDIPAGLGMEVIRQVSFHSPSRGAGPEYEGEWDGVREASERRVIAFANYVLLLPKSESPDLVLPFGKHRGESISEVDTAYLIWFESNIRVMPQSLRDAVNFEISRRQGDRPGAGRVTNGAI